MGVTTQYRVVRAWVQEGKKLSEILKIFQDENELMTLSDDQKQGFLNELIPLGLADLFFFDGEKIAELAMDEGGVALAQSIKKLLGLDLVERLEKDLSVIVREHQKEQASDANKQKIVELQAQLEEAEAAADQAEGAFHAVMPEWVEAQSLLERAEADFLAAGGGFAATRAQDMEKLRQLENQRLALRDEVKAMLSGSYPLALGPSLLASTMKQLERESALERGPILEAYRGKIVSALETKLPADVSVTFTQVLDDTLREMVGGDSAGAVLHNVGARALGYLESTLAVATKEQEKLKSAEAQLTLLWEEIEALNIQIGRAPDEQTLEVRLKSLQQLKEKVVSLGNTRERLREDARNALRKASDIARQLDGLHSEVEAKAGSDDQIALAGGARGALSAYSKRAAIEKTRALQAAFTMSFQRLARKADLKFSAKIDSETFRVTLIDAAGGEIDKSDLSAGERQIYAIAILEALATTSGKRLPIIIDTPLGRLDSTHREKLVKEYFPVASHQVVILSTDTEVDESFYADLYKDMSHAFKLEYDGESGSTAVTEGYFWRQAAGEEVA